MSYYGYFEIFKESIKLIPGIVIFPFSLYFAWKKLGHSISASFSFGLTGFSAPRINEILLTNHKDRAEAIHQIYLRMKDGKLLEVETFKSPLILKPFESQAITTTEFTSYTSSTEEYELDFDGYKTADLFVVTSTKAVKCKISSFPKEISTKDGFHKYKKTFNGIILNSQASFALIYSFDGKQKTAIITDSGYISGEWGFRINHFMGNVNKLEVETFIKTTFGELLNPWQVIDLKSMNR